MIPERILIVGRGSMGKRHFEISRKLFPTAEVAVYSESGDLNSFSLTLRTREEISRFRPEISVIANRTSEHLEFATFLANLNSHLLIEKPISFDLSDIEELLMVKERNRLKILVGYNLQYLGSFKCITDLLAKEKIGRVLDVRIEVGQNLESWRSSRDYRETASAKRRDGGGVLRELSHEINYLLELFGMPRWVYGSTAKVSDLEIDVEDIAHLILGMQGKDGSEFMASLTLDFVRQDKTRKCVIIGTQGTLEWDILAGTIKESTGQPGQISHFCDSNDSISDTYLAEWEDLIGAISVDKEPHGSLEIAINSLEVLLACEESQRTNSRVEFKPKKWSI